MDMRMTLDTGRNGAINSVKTSLHLTEERNERERV